MTAPLDPDPLYTDDYAWLVAGWTATAENPPRKTALLRPDDVLAQPFSALKAIRALILAGHRIVIARKKQEAQE